MYEFYMSKNSKYKISQVTIIIICDLFSFILPARTQLEEASLKL